MMEDSFSGLIIASSEITETTETTRLDSLDLKVRKHGENIFAKTMQIFSIDDLELGETIDEEDNGVFYRAYNRKLKKWVALKHNNLGFWSSQNSTENNIQSIFSKLDFYSSKNKYIVGFDGVFYDDSKRTSYFFFEYMEGGSLHDLYCSAKPNRIPESCVSIITARIIPLLDYLHNKVEGRECFSIKPKNILMDRHGEFKLVRSSKSIRRRKFDFITYVSPEQLNGNKFSPTDSVWSLGVIIMEIAQGGFPFRNNEGKEMKGFWEFLNYIKKNQPGLKKEDGFSEDLIDFVSHCLEFEANNRYSLSQLLDHPLITKHKDNSRSMKEYKEWYRTQIKKITQYKLCENKFLEDDRDEEMRRLFVIELNFDLLGVETLQLSVGNFQNLKVLKVFLRM